MESAVHQSGQSEGSRLHSPTAHVQPFGTCSLRWGGDAEHEQKRNLKGEEEEEEKKGLIRSDILSRCALRA